MQRIIFIIVRMFFPILLYFKKICWYSKEKNYDISGISKLLQKASNDVIKKGRVKANIIGVENIPKEDGFIYYPNHQGLFDVIMVYASSPRPFAFVIKKEMEKVILLKQIIKATHSKAMDRSDLRQSVKIITEVSTEVKSGKNFLIFAEGTRSKQGNKLLDFKGGSFKAATNAKCPIVPCAFINSFRPFDEKGIKPVEVTLMYLPAITYEEYKEMKGSEIANEVKERIQNAINNYLDNGKTL